MNEQTTLKEPRVWEFRVYGEPMQYRTPDSRVLTDKRGHILPKRDKRTGGIIKPFVLIQHLDSRVVSWEWEIRQQIREQLAGQVDPILAEGAVRMELWIFLTRPKSVRSIYPDKAPDRTNFIKSAEDGIEAGLRHDLEFDVEGKVTQSVGFNDGQVVCGPTWLRWAYMDYPDCGRNDPGLLVRLSRVEMSRDMAKAMNADYAAYLKSRGLKYVTETYGRKKDKKRVVLKEVLE